MTATQMTAARERRYPRTCARCAAPFVAARSHARWCSGRCRLRAWRAQREGFDGLDDGASEAGLTARVLALQAALEIAQSEGVCAVQGCRILGDRHMADAVGKDERHVEVAPWRRAAWND